jgi:DNA-binding MarR family transcriptional regulator
VTEWLDERQQRAWRATTGMLIRLPAALDAQLQRDQGLSHFEYAVLSLLSERDDRTMQLSEIAQLSTSSLSRLSHVVGRLEERGWLTRSRLPGPGRRTAATLTDAGHAKVVEAAPGHVATVRDLLVDRLSDDELDTLGRISARVLAAVDPDGRWPA